MKIDGSKNIICLISSYKFTSNKISKIIIDMEDSPKEFIINNCQQFLTRVETIE